MRYSTIFLAASLVAPALAAPINAPVRRQLHALPSGAAFLPSVFPVASASAVFSSAAAAATRSAPSASAAVAASRSAASTSATASAIVPDASSVASGSAPSASPVASGSAAAPISPKPVGGGETTTTTSLTGDPEIDALIGQMLRNPAMQKIMEDLFFELLSGLGSGSAHTTTSASSSTEGRTRTSVKALRRLALASRQESSDAPATTSLTGDDDLDNIIGQLLSNPDVLQFIEGVLTGSVFGDTSSAAAAAATPSAAIETSATTTVGPATPSATLSGRGLRRSFARRGLALEELD